MVIETKKTKVKMTNHIYLGTSMLDISKTPMYKFWYDCIKPKYGDRAKLIYTGTDSFVIHIITEDFFEDISDDGNDKTSSNSRFGILELRNRVTQNDVTLRVTNSKSKNKKLHFELVTRRLNFYFSTLELLTQRWKTKKLCSELLTRGRKIKSFTSSY